MDNTITSTIPDNNTPVVGLGDKKTIARYDILGEIGRGACGVVYRAYDPFVQRDVAIKVASFQNSDDPSQTQRDFFIEAHAAGKLQHPNIVALYDAGVADDVSYIVMEYIDGQTLWDATHRGQQPLSVLQVVEIIYQCAKALAYSHSQGVLHRDIKPSNIMLTKDLEARIMDFSIAEITPNLVYTPDSVMGSPAYMSPEQIKKEALGASSDIYSLGAVMFNSLVGEPPFSSSDIQQVFRAIIHSPPARVDEIESFIPKELGDIVDKCLDKNPSNRYQTGDELAAALTKVLDRLKQTRKQVGRREQQDALKNLSFFAEFDDSEIDEILEASEIVSFTSGDFIIREGDIDKSFYIIAKGEAAVRKGNTVIDHLKTGDCFGEIGFLMETKRTASIIAESSALVLKVNAELMENVSSGCQLRYYKVFAETLIYRLSITSARLSASV